MIVKNEDQWVWFALQSILPYVDQIFLTDTGSTDRTREIITTISSSKITFREVKVRSAKEVTLERQRQLSFTKTPWIWIIDGDEIYPKKTAEEILAAVNTNKYEGIAVRRYDLLGDIYHRQKESIGSYHMLDHTGHLVTRLVNQEKIKGLVYRGDYPLEGWYDGSGKIIHERKETDWYITENYLYHAMYLKRSSLGGNLPMFNRGKYKIETGIKIEDTLPEVFALPHPSSIPDPLRQLDACDDDRRCGEALQSQHRTEPLFHSPMVLLDDVVQVLAAADLHALR